VLPNRNTRTASGQARFAVVDDVELGALEDPLWDIDNILQSGSLEVVYGPTGCGKSTLIVQRACCLATGSEWFGARVLHPGPVLYVALEGPTAMKRKIQAWKRAHAIDLRTRIGIWTIVDRLDLRDEASVSTLLRTIKGIKGTAPREIVVDTLARASLAEETNEAMALVVSRADVIRRHTGARVTLIHHAGKERARGARGGSALTAAADTVISLDEGAGSHVVTCEKQRDGARFASIHLALVPTADGSTVLFEPCAPRGVDLGAGARLRREIVEFLEAHPDGTSGTAIAAALKRQKCAALEALKHLSKAGKVVARPGGRGAQLWVVAST
jgi:hypothetical protein